MYVRVCVFREMYVKYMLTYHSCDVFFHPFSEIGKVPLEDTP